MFNAEFYTQNRAKLRKLVGNKIIVVAGNSLMQRTGDTFFKFRQDSNMLYLSGVQEPNACLVINTRTGDEFIMVDQKQGTALIFDGNVNTQDIMLISGVPTIKNYSEGLAYIAAHAQGKSVLFNEVRTWNKVDFTLNDFRKSMKRRLQARGIKTESIAPIMAQARVVKQLPEIQAIARAIEITKTALAETEILINGAQNESELLASINIHFAKNSVEHAYEPIIASGNNAVTLHYKKNNGAISKNSVVLFDVGAEFEGYAADISRTYIQGHNKRAEDVISAVRGIQSDIIAQVKPGATWKGLSEFALELTANELMRLGVITTAKDAQKYFPHAFGHFLGLDVHDIGDYTQPLSKNMVLTIEPGIYIPEEGIGVRIEDDIIVTATGAKVL